MLSVAGDFAGDVIGLLATTGWVHFIAIRVRVFACLMGIFGMDN